MVQKENEGEKEETLENDHTSKNKMRATYPFINHVSAYGRVLGLYDTRYNTSIFMVDLLDLSNSLQHSFSLS